MNCLETKVIEVIPQLKDGVGFFSKFNNPCWAEEFTNTSYLDMFFGMNYGEKLVSPLLNFYCDDNGKVSNENLTALALMIYDIRGHEWEKLFDSLMAEYNPIENTEVHEQISDTRAKNTTDGNTRTLNTQNTNSGTSNTNSSATGSGNDSNNVFGFDSVTAVGDSSGSNSSQSSSTTQNATNNTINDTGTITDAGSGSESELYTRSYTKHGNIGTQTAADLLGGNIELWKWTFILNIMDDISRIISLGVY